MRSFYLFLVLFFQTDLFVLVLANFKIKCSSPDSLYFPYPETQCQSYYKCANRGEYIKHECNSGYKFEFSTQRCVSLSDKCVDIKCSGQPNGLLNDAKHSCKRFYTCFAGQITSVDNCPTKHLHNGKGCLAEELVKCEAKDDYYSASFFTINQNYDDRCLGKGNGDYPIIGDCDSFLICKDGRLSKVGKCSSGYSFHDKIRKCLPSNEVSQCHQTTRSLKANEDVLCSRKEDGVHKDPNRLDCSSYIICKDERLLSKKQCGDQANFNGKSCIPSPLYPCPLANKINDLHGGKYSKICQNKADGLYSNPEHGCNSFLRCAGRKVFEIKDCPAGNYFDPNTNKCMYERFIENRRCIDRGISLDCDGKPDGFYRESNCESYYYCHESYKTEYFCPNGFLYNGENCVSKSVYKCPQYPEDIFCLSKPDGYYKEPTDGCRAYHYCSKGHKITYLCDEDHSFNINNNQCEPISTKKSLQCKADPICHGKSDGYHVDLRSNCRNYVYCKSSEKIIQITCRDNNVFNGLKCVPPNSYVCPSLYNYKQLNCMPMDCIKPCQVDGFFPDLATNCTEYFFCIGGKASRLSCPVGKRFDGELCMPEDKFECPSICHNDNSSCPFNKYGT